MSNDKSKEERYVWSLVCGYVSVKGSLWGMD